MVAEDVASTRIQPLHARSTIVPIQGLFMVSPPPTTDEGLLLVSRVIFQPRRIDFLDFALVLFREKPLTAVVVADRILLGKLLVVAIEAVRRGKACFLRLLLNLKRSRRRAGKKDPRTPEHGDAGDSQTRSRSHQ